LRIRTTIVEGEAAWKACIWRAINSKKAPNVN